MLDCFGTQQEKSTINGLLKTCTFKTISIVQLMFPYTDFAVVMKSLGFYRSNLQHSLKVPTEV